MDVQGRKTDLWYIRVAGLDRGATVVAASGVANCVACISEAGRTDCWIS